MADTTGKEQNAIWPLPSFYFKVTGLGGAEISFSEVSGLNDERSVIEYRHGNSPVFYPIKMPGMGKVGNVTLKKGVFAKDANLVKWFEEIRMNTISGGRRTVNIQLLNEKGEPTMKWTLQNAWPTKVTSPDLKSTGGTEAAIESIEVAFETLKIENS